MIGWLNKVTNRISKDQKCTCRPEPVKAEVHNKNFILSLDFGGTGPPAMSIRLLFQNISFVYGTKQNGLIRTP